MPESKTNVLYYGDNLDVLRKYLPDECVDLIYLDPPFNSNRSYNVLFKETSGASSEAQIEAFGDTWHWGPAAARAYEDVITGQHQQVARMLQAMVEGLGHNDVAAYLTMIAIRLVELHRVLKPTGSLYLHCDPTASHYLKVILDGVFGGENLRNEITWKRRHGFTSAVHGSNRFGNCTDIILFYAKSEKASFTPQYNKDSKGYKEYVEQSFTLIDENGRRYQATSLTNPAYRPNLIYEYKGYKPPANGWMITKEKMELWDSEGRIHFPKDKNGRLRRKSYADELKGMPIQNLWDDIEQLGAHDAERLGYPTQKPLALLERIVSASSNPGDVVLDPFCGCGTAVHAAHKLGRRWIGIDITHLAIGLIRRRLRDAFPGIAIEVIGEPVDMAGAQELAATKPRQFEYWAVDRLNASPTGGKGPDLDGVKPFMEFGGKAKRAVISVKGTRAVNPEMIREVLGAMSEAKPIGVLVLLTPPTLGMRTAEAAAGFYESSGQKYPRVQIITVSELLAGKQIQVPGPMSPFAQAPLEREEAKQGTLTP